MLLLLASALFSGSEVALFSLDSSAKSALASAGDPAYSRILALLERPRPLLITLRILNTVAHVCAALLIAVMVAGVAESSGWDPTWTLLTQMVALALALIVVSEIAPKLIALRQAPPLNRRLARLILTVHHYLDPISRRLDPAMNVFKFRTSAASRKKELPEAEQAQSEAKAAAAGAAEEERNLIHSVIEFGETTVREVMTSRLDIVALPITATVEEALDLVRTSGHSRLPLYEEHLDNILGIVYAKDLLTYLGPRSDSESQPEVVWTDIARAPMFVPLSKRLDDLLKDFQSHKMHLAVVVDEYGGTAGLVTMEDVLEEIVGDIRDEHDEQEAALYEQIDANTYRFDARIDLDDLNDVLGTRLDTEAFDFETLGGLIFHVRGSIPSPGEVLTYDGLRMQVENVEAHRIGRVLVRLGPPEEVEASEEHN